MEAHKGELNAERFKAELGQEEWKRSWSSRTDGPYADDNRRCWYCGSIHPEDLLKVLGDGATLELADMKYGWPHKLYVRGVPNLLAGQQVNIGSRSGPVKNFKGELNISDPTPEELESGRHNRPTMGTAPPHAVVKFYTEHMLDAGEHFDALNAFFRDQLKLAFKIENGELKYRTGKYAEAM